MIAVHIFIGLIVIGGIIGAITDWLFHRKRALPRMRVLRGQTVTGPYRANRWRS